jgi:hypothetical protein
MYLQFATHLLYHLAEGESGFEWRRLIRGMFLIVFERWWLNNIGKDQPLGGSVFIQVGTSESLVRLT